jgi:hypothetical protein
MLQGLKTWVAKENLFAGGHHLFRRYSFPKHSPVVLTTASLTWLLWVLIPRFVVLVSCGLLIDDKRALVLLPFGCFERS